jgi:hypothetical protein
MCEDYPCCGHERGDCKGQLYGTIFNTEYDTYQEDY